MPIYEYQCKACGHQLEALQRMSDAPLMDCPACNQAELSKKISAAGFRLKGGGWYETDFKTGSKKNLAGDTAKPNKDKPAAGSGTDSGKSASGSGKSASGTAKAS